MLWTKVSTYKGWTMLSLTSNDNFQHVTRVVTFMHQQLKWTRIKYNNSCNAASNCHFLILPIHQSFSVCVLLFLIANKRSQTGRSTSATLQQYNIWYAITKHIVIKTVHRKHPLIQDRSKCVRTLSHKKLREKWAE